MFPAPRDDGAMTARMMFTSAAHAFTDLVQRIPADRWDGPGLGVWSVRSLVGHTSSVLRDVAHRLDEPANSEDITSAAGYYALARTIDQSIYEQLVAASTAVAVEDGVALGGEPSATVDRLVSQALAKIDRAADADLVTSAAGGMRLDNFLQTRTFELVVHSLDIASAVGIDHGVAGEVLGEACTLAARIAVLTGEGVVVLRALTGRGDLGHAFSVV